MSNFITLTCPTCGGRLEVTEDADRFVCVHCGNAHLIDPGEKVAALAAVVEKLQAESDIEHLKANLSELETKRNSVRAQFGDRLQSASNAETKRINTIWGLRILVLVLLGTALWEALEHYLTGAISALGLAIFLGIVSQVAVNKPWLFAVPNDELAKELITLDRNIIHFQHELEKAQRRLMTVQETHQPDRVIATGH